MRRRGGPARRARAAPYGACSAAAHPAAMSATICATLARGAQQRPRPMAAFSISIAAVFYSWRVRHVFATRAARQQLFSWFFRHVLDDLPCLLFFALYACCSSVCSTRLAAIYHVGGSMVAAADMRARSRACPDIFPKYLAFSTCP